MVSFFMQEYVVYILCSKSNSKKYIGYTSNLIERFKSHNSLSTKGFTIRFRPWFVAHVEFLYDKKEAIAREKFLKSGIGRIWIKENVNVDI
jgi:putative endonuclease